MYFRVQFLEFRHHLRQRITRLGVGGGDGEAAAVLLAVLLRQILDVARVQQHAFDDLHHLLARFGQAQQTLALAHEQFDAEFVFQILDVFRHAGLRCVQRVGHFRQIEIAPHGFADDPQLLKIHRRTPSPTSERSNTFNRDGSKRTICPATNASSFTRACSISTSKCWPVAPLTPSSSTRALTPKDNMRLTLALMPAVLVGSVTMSSSWGRAKAYTSDPCDNTLLSCGTASSPTRTWFSSMRPWNRFTEPRKPYTNGVAG